MDLRIKIYMALIGGVCFLSGCDADEFLEIKPRGKDVPSTIQHYEGLLNSFPMATSNVEGNLYFPLLSDEFYATKASINQLSMQMQGPQGGNAFRYEADIMRPDENCSDWIFNSTTYTYNIVINEVMDAEDGTTQQKLALQSEARVMRAWSHFLVAQVFCKPYNEATAATDLGIPILRETDITEMNYPRGTVKEVYDFIVGEMEEACPNIPNNDNLNYRTERADAYLFLGTVYCYMNRYDKALEALRLANQYARENNAFFLYDYNDPTVQMTMMMGVMGIMPYDNKEYMRCMYAINTALPMCLPLFNYYSPTTVYIKPKCQALFEGLDYRKMLRLGQGVAFGDIDLRPVVPAEVPLGANAPDLLLLLAECEARVGDMAKAREALFELRKSRMPEAFAAIPATVTTKDQLIRFCVEERIRELTGTGRFFFDMRRLWNDPLFADYKADYKHEIVDASGNESFPLTEDRLVMRIPPEVMNWNPWEDNK